MRRLFSTIYRILLTAAAISAVVFSILAATSCDFLDFVHPYETNGRSSTRNLQNETDDIANGDTTTPTTVGLVDTDYLAQLTDSISAAGNRTDDDSEKSNQTDDISYTDDIPENSLSNAYGENMSDVPSVAASGSAGLFCSANDVSIFDIWKGTLLDSEMVIDEESDHNQSEDIARNSAIVAIIFGVLVALIFVLQTIFGLKMCCEKWIVGFLAIVTCISQGVTFMFFNSQRYCDANIIHEIMARDPCVVGTGGTYSIVALVLYFVISILICCAPSADPYHLCCCCFAQKESVVTNPNLSSLELANNQSSDEAGNGDESNVALSGRGTSSAPWMSKNKEKEENEII